ncbi:hypothetical protein LMH87_001942 [Akanthomyces muscarius]|uniref:Uncharacterized protein n=1 Tax=Akanthomyces muscarius TaxID=2231603 RepID=A0A9W8Q5C5_AKAMU|nr:hypothetical protein LMH87_001942 [Akanthomyces muscarius]KAJ4147422.1 hypothetical protein LMH87_001942 [Akanthomyces muscarius]
MAARSEISPSHSSISSANETRLTATLPQPQPSAQQGSHPDAARSRGASVRHQQSPQLIRPSQLLAEDKSAHPAVVDCCSQSLLHCEAPRGPLIPSRCSRGSPGQAGLAAAPSHV